MLLDVESVLPLTVTGSFRPQSEIDVARRVDDGQPRLGREAARYYITEETDRFVGMIGSPTARDVSVMPYQEEPRDVPSAS